MLDVRPHLGGNCYDFESLGTRVRCYGPHVFHSTSPQVVSFLSRFTEWDEYRYWVEAEIEDRGPLFTVPFPYSRLDHGARAAVLRPTAPCGWRLLVCAAMKRRLRE